MDYNNQDPQQFDPNAAASAPPPPPPPPPPYNPGGYAPPYAQQTYPGMPPMYQSPMPYGANPPGRGMAIASLVLGILALVLPYAGILCAIVGLVLGVVGQKKLSEIGQPAGMATAGMIMSIIALVWAVVVVILCSGACATTYYYW